MFLHKNIGSMYIYNMLLRELVDEKYQPYIDYVNNNYDYCYLDSMHYINEHQNTQAIITGLSYGLAGIDAREMKDTINFCMHSQDLYYDFLHAKRAVLSGKGQIRKCYLTIGYYSLFYDLSLSSAKSMRIIIYGALFGDYHHAKKIVLEEEISDIEIEKYRCFAHEFFSMEPSYYGGLVAGEQLSEIYNIYQKHWKDISEEDRIQIAGYAALKHNHHIKRTETFKENVEILEKYIQFLVQNNIQPIVVIMPLGEEYRGFILKEYKDILLKILEVLPYRIDFVDMNDLDVFKIEDFLDVTHLNQQGAVKAAKVLNEMFDTE